MAVITLNNPSKLNALTEDMGNELTAKVGELQEKKGLRAAILTGGPCSKRLKIVKGLYVRCWESIQCWGRPELAAGETQGHSREQHQCDAGTFLLSKNY